MKKTAAILLLFIFTFNLVGYQLMYNFKASQADAALEQALDANQYNDSQLISIKQPINLPYYTNSAVFNRIDGEVEIDGTTYKYVKCRVYNDSLEMLCIPHVEKMKIQQSKQAYAKGANDFQQDNATKKSIPKSPSIQKQLSEYDALINIAIATNTYTIIGKNTFGITHTVLPNNHFFTTVEQPPDASIA